MSRRCGAVDFFGIGYYFCVKTVRLLNRALVAGAVAVT